MGLNLGGARRRTVAVVLSRRGVNELVWPKLQLMEYWAMVVCENTRQAMEYAGRMNLSECDVMIHAPTREEREYWEIFIETYLRGRVMLPLSELGDGADIAS